MSQLHDAEVEFVIHTPKVGGKKKVFDETPPLSQIFDIKIRRTCYC
jgi:hypothetical protein